MSLTIEAAIVLAILTTGLTPEEYNVDEVRCVTEAINWEAGNQPEAGKKAVAHVILNRASADGFPDGVCRVTKQRSAFGYHRIKKEVVRGKKEVDQLVNSAKVALKVLSGHTTDPTEGALYFVNLKTATDTKWLNGVQRLGKIGDHTFYKEKIR